MRASAEIVEPYAQALMSIAQSQNLVDQFNDDITLLLETITSSEDLSQFLSNPFMRPETKKAVLSQVAGDRVHPVMYNFLQLLVDRGRSLFLPAICKQYQALVRQMRQIVLAEVTSSVELNDSQTEAVREKVIALTGANQVELEKHIDSDILGGVIIRVGSQVFDASLRGQLRRLGLNLSTSF